MTGYVAMRRDWQDHDIFDGEEFSRRDAWAWLIANAAWKQTKARIKGTTVELERGELCFSQRFLATKWKWSKSKVDRFIATLRAEGMIATRSKIGATAGHQAGQGQSIITICNYDKFQSPLKPDRGNDEPPNGATAGQQRGKEEEGNKVITLANASAAGNSDKLFWENAKAYLGPSKASLIGKWVRDHGKEATAAAISAAQVDRAIDPVEFIQGRFRKARAQPMVPL